VKKLLLLLAPIVLTAPAHAWSNQLQWRSTTCQLEQDGNVIAVSKCKAGFAYDTAIRAVKYWDEGLGQWLYHEVGRPGVSFGNVRECVQVNYVGGEQQAFCTTQTPEQLGIQGD
jgi:hypothetical protein